MGEFDPLGNQDFQIAIDPNKPVILCDADEVIVYFVRPLEAYLAENGFSLDLSSYNLFGNIRHLSTNEVAHKELCIDLLKSFFDKRVDLCPPVDGAQKALKKLSQHAQIIVLSNVPFNARKGRERSLAANGMPFPVIANEGPKGPAVRTLLHNHKSKVFFIDDIASHHKSVAEHAGHVRRIHFVADPRLSKLLDNAEHAHARLNHWNEIENFILNHLQITPENEHQARRNTPSST